MESLHSPCSLAIVLVIFIGFCSGNADILATVKDGGEGIVRSVLYVDNCQQGFPNKNCFKTINRADIPNGSVSDVQDQIVITRENDPSNCRNAACLVDKRGGGSNRIVNVPNRPEENYPVAPSDINCSTLFPNSPGIRCNVFVDREGVDTTSQTFSQNNGRGATIHISGGVSSTRPATSPGRVVINKGHSSQGGFVNRDSFQEGFVNRDSSQGGFVNRDSSQGGFLHRYSSQGGFVHRDNVDRVIHVVEKPRILERSSVSVGSLNVPRRKYLQIVPNGDRDGLTGGRTYTYRIKGIRLPERYVSGQHLAVTGQAVTSNGRRGSLHIRSRGGYRPTSGSRIAVVENDRLTEYPRNSEIIEVIGSDGGYSDANYQDYSGNEGIFEVIETDNSRWNSQGYGGVEIINEGFSGGELQAGSAGYGGQVYVSGSYYEDEHSSGPHYDTINEYYYHHSK